MGQGKDGFLTLQGRPLIAAVVKAIQEIASVTGTFKANLIAWLASAENSIHDLYASIIHAHEVHSDELCAGSTCVNEIQLKAMLAASAAAGAATARTGAPAATPASLAENASATSSSTTAIDNQPPTIHINGNNPATVSVGATYADLGATITGPTADLNLGIHTFVDGIATDPVAFDTSVPGTHSIEYVVTDQAGLTSTTTRTVNVQLAANDNQATSTPSAANDNTPLPDLQATGTDATSTAQ